MYVFELLDQSPKESGENSFQPLFFLKEKNYFLVCLSKKIIAIFSSNSINAFKQSLHFIAMWLDCDILKYCDIGMQSNIIHHIARIYSQAENIL